MMWSVITMYTSMSLHISLAYKTLLAVIAIVRFYFTVQSLMFLRAYLQCKCFTTYWTCIGFDEVYGLIIIIKIIYTK